MRKSVLAAVVALATGVIPGLSAHATAPRTTVNPHIHAMKTRAGYAADRAAGLGGRGAPGGQVGVNTPCYFTASPGCTPIPLMYNTPILQTGCIGCGTGPAVETTSTNYVIYWEPAGSTTTATYHTLIDRFFDDVGGSSLYGTATQYYKTSGGSVSYCGAVNTTTCTYIANSSIRGASYVDTRAYPHTTLTDADIQGEVTAAMTANGWTGGMGKNFFVFLPRGVNQCYASGTCAFTTYCAYHSYFMSGSTPIMYASMPFVDTNRGACGYQSADLGLLTSNPTGPNGDIAADEEISTASHELMETVTDPQVNAWYDASGYENGDKCAYTYGAIEPNGSRPISNMSHNGHSYLVQLEWDNASAGCKG